MHLAAVLNKVFSGIYANIRLHGPGYFLPMEYQLFIYMAANITRRGKLFITALLMAS
jgi:hypothetical protein